MFEDQKWLESDSEYHDRMVRDEELVRMDERRRHEGERLYSAGTSPSKGFFETDQEYKEKQIRHDERVRIVARQDAENRIDYYDDAPKKPAGIGDIILGIIVSIPLGLIFAGILSFIFNDTVAFFGFLLVICLIIRAAYNN